MKMTRMELSENIAYWRNQQETRTGEHMKTLQYLITLLFFCFLCGCNTPSGDKQATKDDSTLGQMVIIPQFDYVGDFHEGLAKVWVKNKKTDKWGFINKKGKWVIKPQFNYVGDFHDELAKVWFGDKKIGKWGFMDKQGNWVIKPQFNYVDDFHDGLAKVWFGDNKIGKWGFMDKQGNWVIKPQFNYVGDFHDELAMVRKGDDNTGKWGFIDKKGNWVIKPQFNSADSFSEGLAGVYLPSVIDDGFTTTFKTLENSGFLFIDKQGKIYTCNIGESYDKNVSEMWPFSDGLAKVKMGSTKFTECDTYGFINKQGEMVVRPRLYIAQDFSDGLAGACDTHRELVGRQLVPIDKYDIIKPGTMVVGNFIVKNEGRLDITSTKWGYINKQGIWVIPPQFDEVGKFSNGLARIRIDVKWRWLFTANQWGFIDQQGKMVIYPQFDDARDFSEGLAAVRIDSKWGFISCKANTNETE